MRVMFLGLTALASALLCCDLWAQGGGPEGGEADPAAGAFTQVAKTSARAWGDCNNDGWPDMVGTGSVWINNKDGTFTESTPFTGMDYISLGDHNNDGFLDVYGYQAGEHGGADGGPRLYTNKGGAGWSDDSAKLTSLAAAPGAR